jgi:hypothetical protein
MVCVRLWALVRSGGTENNVRSSYLRIGLDVKLVRVKGTIVIRSGNDLRLGVVAKETGIMQWKTRQLSAAGSQVSGRGRREVPIGKSSIVVVVECGQGGLELVGESTGLFAGKAFLVHFIGFGNPALDMQLQKVILVVGTAPLQHNGQVSNLYRRCP